MPPPAFPEPPVSPPLGVRFLRSLVRVPPSASYSLLSAPYCPSPAESKRRHKSFAVSFYSVQLRIRLREHLVIAAETSLQRISFSFNDLLRELGTEIGIGFDGFEAGEPGDIPIKPGDTYVFKIHPGQIAAWEKSVREGKHPGATKLKIKLESLSFGDGTGYFGNSGSLYPPAAKQQSGLNRGAEEPERHLELWVVANSKWPEGQNINFRPSSVR